MLPLDISAHYILEYTLQIFEYFYVMYATQILLNMLFFFLQSLCLEEFLNTFGSQLYQL